MKRTICILLILSLLFCGCSSTLYPLTKQGYDEVNTKSESRDITIVLGGSEEEIEAENIRLDVDSLYWMYTESGKESSIPTNMVSEIVLTNRLVGLLIGLCVGLIPLTAVALDEKDADESSKEHGLAQLLLGLSSVILAIGTTLAGYFIGVDHSYAVQDPAQWSDFKNVEGYVDLDWEEKALEILNRIIEESEDDRYITTALFLKMKYELEDHIAVYEELKSRYPDHIYTTLAERLLVEEYGIRPVDGNKK